MADYILNVKINGVEQSVSSVGQLESALANTNAELSNIEVTSGDVSKGFKTTIKDADGLNKSLNSVNTSAKNLGQTITAGAQTANALKESGKSADKLGESVDAVANKSTSLRTELRKVTIELQGLEPGSARFQELSLRAGQLRDEIADTSAVISSLAGTSVERFGKALSNSVQLGVAGFQALQSAQALFGDDNEEIQKTLVRLTALLNLSQAIETFGGLGDKITEIRAGFSSLFTQTTQVVAATTAEATAAGAATAAIGAQTVATEGATVATTALGVAMKALPIVAIVAAVATLAYGIYEYVSANKEAEEEEKKRKEAAEELIKAAEEQRKTIAAESGEFVLLITRLSQTNAGSQERLDLIKQINQEYKTTLKNLSDETEFQKQLSVATAEYIKFQTNKFNISKNQEKFNKLLEEQSKLNESLRIAQANVTAEQERQSKMQDRINPLLEQAQDQLKKVRAELDANTTSQEKLAMSSSNLLLEQEKLTNGGKTYAESAEEERKAQEAVRKAEEARRKGIEELKTSQDALTESSKKLQEQEDKFAQDRVKNTKTIIDDLNLEKSIALRNATDEFTQKVKLVTAEITNKKLRAQTIKQLELDQSLFIQKLTDDYNRRIQKQAADELKAQLDKIETLKIQNEILQKEITVGDQTTTDTFTRLELDKVRIAKAGIDQRLANEQFSLSQNFDLFFKNYKDIENLQDTSDGSLVSMLAQRIKLEKDILVKSRQEELSQIEIQNAQKLVNQEKYYETTFGVAVKFDKEQNKYVLDSNQETLTQLEGETKEAFQQRLDAQKKIQEDTLTNINKEAENLEKEKNAKLSQVNEEYRQKEAAADKKASDDVLKYKLDQIKLYADQIFAIANGITDLIAGLNEIQKVNDENRLNELRDNQVEQTNIVTTEFNNQQMALEEQLNKGQISKEQYDAKIYELDNLRKDRTKSIEDKIATEQKNIRRKAFESEKNMKIAQAVISGAQGALNAFLGPFSNPALVASGAAPIIGGILAALAVASTTAQVAAIKKTKFDEGAPTPTEVSGAGGGGASGAIATSQVTQSSTGGFTGFSPTLTGSFGTPNNPTQPTTTGTTTPLKVYVVESDITDSQNRVRTLESNATFG